ncbi:uncharacterized protein Z518_03003 [Rhinocladiella mackenziei CBS 650.93]|uniref:Transglutaminase-like domain-containing protein n=1 Tax=Rhinocladiella mackenziei CBS 650.93 TaxID=1442369 RepID=A0A0D2G1C3_9EURO|nr:uncharacterized protein Z518_03003 [Rhinocladiella mackenziei CBS 650.93]KIX08347.1 hypothetical protein Z518_03003 [Rhinocladiella mackenziei CBS 650.93]
MAEDPQPLTLQQRIAALNAAHIGRIPGDPPSSSHPTPPLPTKRPVVVKQNSINNPPERVNGSVIGSGVGNQPVPPPPPARKQPPPLPSRNSSLDEQRRGSVASIASSGTNDTTSSRVTSTRTKSTDSASRIKAPAWGECELPALPPKGAHHQPVTRKYSDDKPKYVNRAPSSTSVAIPATSSEAKPQQRPSLPPRLPSRKHDNEHRDHAPDPPLRKIPPMPSNEAIEKAKRAAFSYISPKDQSHAETVPVVESLPLPVKEQVLLPVKDHVPLPAREAIPVPIREHIPLPVREHIHLPAREIVSSHQADNQPLPPPVPLSSRPDLSTIQATKPNFTGDTVSVNTSSLPSTKCLICRDFSGPDHQATLFPRTNVSSLQNLAHQLTSPFPSPTDKARAIFTWLHHNIAYDVVSFFGNSVKSSTPQSTLQTGLAVCEGYAALFTNLASYAGLESVVISGHGKGYGFTPLPPGSALPPYSAGHAWNAVKIDNGEWKLIDACWGAGYVQGAGRPYVQKFNPDYFTMPNEQFAVKHFPGNKDQFFLPGGRRMSWEEYIVIDPACWPDTVEGPTVFTNAKEDYSIGEKTIYPRARKINVRQPDMVRFQFGLVCPHWTLKNHTRKGPPPVFIVSVHGVDGRHKDHIPLEHYPGSAGQGGDTWVVDISARELGAPGQTVTLFAITSFGDRQDARGLTVREFRDGKGRVGMGFTGVAAWDLV